MRSEGTSGRPADPGRPGLSTTDGPGRAAGPPEGEGATKLHGPAIVPIQGDSSRGMEAHFQDRHEADSG